ncbi:MAG: PEP-CTERM sorting domain-containing protein, partial [Verrucomicrobiaceae bacterium]
PDGGRALRLRGPSSTGENAYSGTITVNPSFKFEILTSVDAGSPIGTGNLRMAGGTTTGNALGTYSLVNVRNNFAGDTTFGNDVEVTGVGSTYFNMLSDNSVAPVGSVVNFGKLIIGDAQAIAAVATASPAYTLAFSSVELTGGNATFTPRPVGNTSFVSTQNISLGAISERTVGSGITMNGAATLTLTGNNTYTGPTFVNSGILEVTGSISGSTVDLSGGTLRGSGTTGPVNVNGGTLAPGSGVGSLSTGAVAFQAGVFALEIGGSTVGSYDQLKVTGGLAFNAPITLTLDFSTFDPADGDSFVLVDNDLADPIVFADETSGLYYDFALLSEGSSFTVTSGAFTQEFTITYEGGTNANDIVLTAVPEPSAMVALLGGVAMLAGFRRRR